MCNFCPSPIKFPPTKLSSYFGRKTFWWVHVGLTIIFPSLSFSLNQIPSKKFSLFIFSPFSSSFFFSILTKIHSTKHTLKFLCQWREREGVWSVFLVCKGAQRLELYTYIHTHKGISTELERKLDKMHSIKIDCFIHWLTFRA